MIYDSLSDNKKHLRRVQLGSGDNINPDWINIDFIQGIGVDIVHDLRTGLPFGDNELSEIYSHHVLEHFNYYEIRKLLPECLRCLKPGGILISTLPNFEACARNWLNNIHRDSMMIGMLGGQASGWKPKEGQTHSYGYSPDTMQTLLKESGFNVLRCEAVGSNTEIPVIHLTAKKKEN